MSFFDDAIQELLDENPLLDPVPPKSKFLDTFDHEVKLLLADVVYGFWDVKTAEYMRMKIREFLVEYSNNNPFFEYKLDDKNFFRKKELFVDYRDLKHQEFQTAHFCIHT